VIADGDAQITDLKVDDHACLTYGEPEELLDLTAGPASRLLSHHSFTVGHAMDWLTGEMTASRLDADRHR
jgi:hypothetical protein